MLFLYYAKFSKGGRKIRLAGLQKLTLIDYPGKVACIVFTVGCNFKCPFCHNASLVNGTNDYIDEESVLEFLKKRKGILEGVVITGGEPLLNGDIAEFIKKIKDIGYPVKLDTNGTNPKLLKELVNNRLVDYVAMDIKNSLENYLLATGNIKLDLNAINESIDFLLQDVVDYEFRTTVVNGIHTTQDIVSIANRIKNAKRYFLQQYKPSKENLSPDGLSEFSKEEMNDFLKEASKYIKNVNLRGL